MTAPTPNGHRAARPGRPRALVAVGLLLAAAAVVGGALQLGTGSPDPDPVVADYARELGGEVREPLPPGQPEEFEHGPSIGGCAVGYGLRGECVPYTFPRYVADTYAAKCAWLEAQGAGALEVPGEDRHRLVPRGAPVSPLGNPYACPEVLRPSEGVAPS